MTLKKLERCQEIQKRTTDLDIVIDHIQSGECYVFGRGRPIKLSENEMMCLMGACIMEKAELEKEFEEM